MRMMGRDRAGVEAAMAGFTSMLEDDKDSNVRALLGMSIAFTLDESPSKARHTTLIFILDIEFYIDLVQPFFIAVGW